MAIGSETFEKANDYTLHVSQVLDTGKNSKPTLRRIFNFKARTVTHIYERGMTNSNGGGFTSSMMLQKFSELDSLEEVAQIREVLIRKGGTPPALPDPDGSLGKPLHPRLG